MQITPLVSVIMPTYKRSDMLIRAIDSVLYQTYANVEVIVVDDNDSHTIYRTETEQKMKKYKSDDRVTYIKHHKNSNGSVARNTGIRFAKGEIITFLDDDDIYLKDKIEKQVDFLLQNRKYRAVYCGWKRDNIEVIPKAEGDISYNLLSGQEIIITNSIMMWREDAILCGGWNENLKRHQEAAFLLNYLRFGGKVGRISDVLVEFDTSDRSNVANPVANEEQLVYLLNEYSDLIHACESANKGSSNKIYCSRYLGIILTYLKYNDFLSALRKYFFITCKYPINFNLHLLKYCITRLSPSYKAQSR